MAGTSRIIIAAPQSGSGKTTICAGLIAALATRQRVQPFKCGPDYIDPTYHSVAAGRPSRNLDTWMLSDNAVRELFERACRDADIALIEGVMGLFDGKTGEDDAGSTAYLAKLLNAPVILVIDAGAVARSAAALVHGFHTFDPEVRLAGVIVNRVAGEGHYRIVAGAIERDTGVPVLGYLARDAELELPERYLGLIPTVEGAIAADYFRRLRVACERTVNISGIRQIAASAPPLSTSIQEEESLFPASRISPHTRIALARDGAFSFYYEDNLDLLRAWGAEIVEFSPLADDAIPPGSSAIYIGGGFPELFAEELAENRTMLQCIRTAAQAGMPVYAECGGLMYAGERMTDAKGTQRDMLGLVPARSTMGRGRLSLGYRELRALQPSPVLSAGAAARAHEFHYSSLDSAPDADAAAYSVDITGPGTGRMEGYRRGSVLASYMHLHFGSSRAIAPRFVAAAEAWATEKTN